MRLISIFAALMLLSLGAFGAAFEKSVQYRALTAVISAEKPLVVGTNTVNIHITQKGEAVDGDVKVKVFMPAMPGMPYMEDVSDAKALGSGRYESQVSLSMGGTWQVHIFITLENGKKYRLKSSVNI